MSKKHDFKGALRVFEHMVTKDHVGNRYETICGDPVETIQYALRLADRLQSGEVSDEIITRMVHEWTLYAKASAPTNIMWKAVADAMTTQLMKEVDDG